MRSFGFGQDGVHFVDFNSYFGLFEHAASSNSPNVRTQSSCVSPVTDATQSP
ncbi:MAG: hypothetical protein ABLQ96_03450 [Candidatus Acidiferrum sp.]